MAIRDILKLGHPGLLERCAEVAEHERAHALEVGRDLRDTRADFRARHGWGRAIAAPQIGVAKRIVFVHADEPLLLLNPVLSNPSAGTLELWDDCMSFPELLVRVRRHVAFDLTYRDADWTERTLHVEGALSELLQHELDHLDGILAVSRAIDGRSFALQSERARLGESSFANAPKGSRVPGSEGAPG